MTQTLSSETTGPALLLRVWLLRVWATKRTRPARAGGVSSVAADPEAPP